MYLMNVPPVAATHTEWRTCGPQRGYSLPICFNDSDTELSRGTPISDKVQMIIESLRSSQSSTEMGDEIEGNVLSGQEAPPKACKVTLGSDVGVISKDPTENHLASVSSPVHHKRSDSDSDDSVDRGIEEAILEYLKEKDDHKRKAEPCMTFLQSSKIPKKTPLIPEISEHNADRNACVISGNQFPKHVNVDPAPAPLPPVLPIKKHIKNNDSIREKMKKKLDSIKSIATKSSVLPKEQTKSPSKTISFFNKITYPVTVKMEEDLNDSSSDDGIEEAIQRYQLEKKEQESKREAFNIHQFQEDSDSTSDDGIEEAIRSYQLEQLKEKTALKPATHKQKPFGKSLIHTVGSSSVENAKKNKLRKKKARTDKEVQSTKPPSLSGIIPKNTLSDALNNKGNGLVLLKEESFKEHLAPNSALPKVNTTAELMCAEAILDISKTVMPEAFCHSVGLCTSSSCTNESSRQPSPAHNPAEESDGSSIDSEDGIEQEIRKFLEQKAQIHKQLPDLAIGQEIANVKEPEEMNTKQIVTQKKPSKLSLTQRRKHREENMLKISETDVNVTRPTLFPDHEKELNPPPFCQKKQMHALAGLHQTEPSGEKSSSLDSDEDLDTAIKDLLKTKKRSKKKVRDLKRKTTKVLKDEEAVLGNTLQTKKFKHDTIFKHSPLKNIKKTKADKTGLNKMSVSQTSKSETCDIYDSKTGKLKGTEAQEAWLLHNTQSGVRIKEDSSSVDSDDSIEQEIRRFLAEKAKVCTAEKGKNSDISRNGTGPVDTPIKDEDTKQENQLAEIPRKTVSLFPGQSPLSRRPDPVPQSLQPVVSTAGIQSCLTSVPSSKSILLEPADGAGAARSEQRPGLRRSDIQEVTTQMDRVRPVLSPKNTLSRSDAIKWRQCLGLPTTDSRTFSRTPFYITASKISDTASAAPPFSNRTVTPKSQTTDRVWSSVRTSSVPFSGSAERAVNTTFRSPVLSLFSAASRHQSMTQNRSQCPIEGETQSMVHVPKDKTVFVELESNRTNHVQVRSSNRSEQNEGVDLLNEKQGEVERMKIDDKEVHLERTEEFIDEADCESDNRRNPEKQQGFPPLSLSRAIDPGITFEPCIALTTEERRKMFNRNCLARKCTKGLHSLSSVQNKTSQYVKRKLQFIPVSR